MMNVKQPTVKTEAELDTLLQDYANGQTTRKALEAATGLWFGDILQEMARRGLKLPRVDSRTLMNDEAIHSLRSLARSYGAYLQKALFAQVVG